MDDTEALCLHTVDSFEAIMPSAWDALTDGNPLLQHAFFLALETSKSIGADTGWQAMPLLATQQQRLIGALPLFVKSHSYGEYVFDWAWADAYAKNGLAYYPKLLVAIPFSPVTGTRLLAADHLVKSQLLQGLEAILQQHNLSGGHVLFTDEPDAGVLEAAGWLKRIGVQFRWHNQNYRSFEDFLQTLSHDKRKKIHQERKKIAQAGVDCCWIKGADITEADWDFFYQCYCNTYREHYSSPYLTRAFFSALTQLMPQQLLLIVAKQHGKPIAATLNLYNQNTLYGRYWGATQFVSGLHFELCYYQAQQFCIAENITFFEGGAQGEHKLARGFEPRATCSFHKIMQPDFARAIQDFIAREADSIVAYSNELDERAPYKAR